MTTPEGKTGELMPKESAPTDENKRLRALTRGWVTDDKLAVLRETYKDITVTTTKGYKECVKAIGVVRKYRTTLEKSRLEKNRKEQENISDRNKEAKRINAILVEIETPLKEMRRVEDERIAKEKAEKEKAEKERVAAIKQRIEQNFGQHCLEDLAGKPSAYVQARIAQIEAREIDGAYLEFEREALCVKQDVISTANRIYQVILEKEQNEKRLKAEKAEINAQKQKLADEAKRIKEQQKAFEEERAQWEKQRAAKEEARKEAEAEGSQAREDAPSQEETAQAGTGGAEEEIQGHGGQVTEQQLYVFGDKTIERYPEDAFEQENQANQNRLESEPESELESEPESELESDAIDGALAAMKNRVAAEALVSYGRRTNREKLLELIQAETGIKEFSDDDLADLLSLASGMYLSSRYNAAIRNLADVVKRTGRLIRS